MSRTDINSKPEKSLTFAVAMATFSGSILSVFNSPVEISGRRVEHRSPIDWAPCPPIRSDGTASTTRQHGDDEFGKGDESRSAGGRAGRTELTTEDKKALVALLGALIGILDALCGCGIKYHWGPVLVWATLGIAETLVGLVLGFCLTRQVVRKLRAKRSRTFSSSKIADSCAPP